MTLFTQRKKGYIALMSAIIISLILTGMTFALSGSGYFSRFNVLNSEYKRVSLGLAESCVNSALMNISQNYAYAPAAVGDSINIGAQHCLIKSVTYGPEVAGRKAAYITAQADYQGAFSNVKVSATIASTTYSNASRATLSVVVHVVNDSGGAKQASDVTVSVDPLLSPLPSAPFQGSESGTTLVLSAGTVSLTSTTLSGYSLPILSSECTSAITNGQSKTCVITYNDNSNTASITVIANIKNNDGGTKGPSDFKLYLNGAEVVPGQAYIRSPGTYTVSGTPPPGYSVSPWGYDCDAIGNVALFSGDNKTCKINYDDVTPPAPACADTVVMIDRTGSLSSSDLAAERVATKGLLDLYAKIANPPQVGIGRFGGASGSNADIVGQLTNSYGINATSSAVGPMQPTSTASPSNWQNSTFALTADGAFASSPTAGDKQGYHNFTFSIPPGSTVSGIEVILEGKAAAGPQSTSVNFLPNAVGNVNTTSWTTNSGSNVNANKIAAVNDSNQNSYITATASSSQSFKFNTSSIPAGAVITGVTLTAVAEKTSSGAPAMYMLIEKGTTQSNQRMSLVSGLSSTAWITFSTSTTKDPFTGLNWSTSSLASYGFGIAKNSSGQVKVAEIGVIVDYTVTPPPSGSVGVNLSWNNGASWTTNAKNMSLTGIAASTTLGSPSDTWGRTWAAGEFSDGNLVLRLTNNTPSGSSALIDFIKMRVTYVSPSTGLYAAVDSNLVTTSSGGTDIGSSINVGYGEVSGVRHDGSKAKVMIMLSDGLPTVPNNSSSTVLAASDSAKQNGTSIYFLHFGSGSGNDLSAKIASGTTTVPGHQNGSKNDAGTANGNVSQANADKENNDGDNFFISPTFAQLDAIFQQVGTAVCPAAGAASVAPPTTGNVYVVTHVVNDNGGLKHSSDFTMSASGINSSLPSPFSGAGTPGILVRFSPGSYNITETSIGGYTEIPGIGCSGTISGGDNFTCVFTNDDNAPPPPPPPPPPPGIDIGPWIEASTTSPGP